MVGNNSALQILGVYSNNLTDITEQDATVDPHLANAGNRLANPEINYNPQTISEMNFFPKKSYLGEVHISDNPWVEQVSFKGAFGTNNWLKKVS
jgi:hypothetical protein